MALSKSESKKEVSNLACIARILLGPCTDTLRDILTHRITPSDFKEEFRYIFGEAYGPKELFIGLQLLVYQYDASYSDFDIPLLYFFLVLVYQGHFPRPELWHFSSEENRSLFANIRRIYKMHKKYKYFQDDFLKNSTFEQDWEVIFQTVKKLEEYIGSATAYQDAMKKIKNSSMDPDVEHLFIAKLGYGKGVKHGTHFSTSSWAKVTTMLECKEDAQVYAIRSIEAYLESFPESSLHLEEASGNPAFDIRDIDFHRHHFEERRQALKGELSNTGRSQRIPSKKLKKLFSSFKVVLPDDVPGEKSFAREILEDDIPKIESAIVSLSKGFALESFVHPFKYGWPQDVKVIVDEVNVVYEDGDQLCVFIKDNSSDVLFKMLKDNCIRIIKISSGSIPVVLSKLIAYKTFRRAINENEIYLQHEYSDIDDVAKLIANKIVSSFCLNLDLVIHAFTNDLHKMMFYNYDKPLKATEIRQMCLHVLNGIAHKHKLFGSTKTRRWTQLFSHSIQERIFNIKVEITGANAWDAIQKACQKTVEDFKFILNKLEDFKKNELSVNQEKEIGELLKREVIEDKALLPEYPSFIKCIAGQRDDKNVVKVYHSGDITEEAKDDFKEKCKLEKTDFEFVNIDGTNEMPDEIKKTEALEREPLDIDRSNMKELDNIIETHTDKLYASYSNIIGIRIGRRVHCDKLEQCIIIYCLDKTLIPFGEKNIPETLEGWPCDLREDFIMLGMCSTDCKSNGADYPKLGCRIGRLATTGFGSVGFMYESRDSDISGFLTASHVAVENCGELHKGNQLMSSHHLGQKEHIIVHPSWVENNCVDHPVGQVVESFFGNYESSEGLDFAAVKTNKRREGEKETVEVYTEDNEIFKKKVMKTGGASDLAYGLLLYKMNSITLNHPPKSKYKYIFKNIYIVRSKSEQFPFFLPGDSGSGVFVEGEREPVKALGIGFGISASKMTYVCKIDKILNTLGLKIVKYM